MLLRRLFCDDGRAFSRAGGAGLERCYAGLSSLLRTKREPEMVLALVARIKFFLLVKRLALRAGQRQGGVFRLPPPYLWTPLSPQRVKGCSPLTIPKRKSKRKKASRCAKTGCGAQRPLRALSGTRVLLTAAPTAPPCIRRRRRSSLLRIFCASPIYGSADDFTLLLDVTVSREVTPAAKQQIGETRKKRLAKRLAFFRFDNSFGV